MRKEIILLTLLSCIIVSSSGCFDFSSEQMPNNTDTVQDNSAIEDSSALTGTSESIDTPEKSESIDIPEETLTPVQGQSLIVNCRVIDVNGKLLDERVNLGDIVNYNITITNNGDTAIEVYNMTIAEDSDAMIASNAENPQTFDINTFNTSHILNVGETWTYTATHTISTIDVQHNGYSVSVAVQSEHATGNVYDTATLTMPIDSSFTKIIPSENNTGFVKASGAFIELYANTTSSDPTYEQMISFLNQENANTIPRQDNVFTSGDCAEKIFNDAELAGILTHFIIVKFDDNTVFACVSFNTTDKGTYYIDVADGKYTATTSINTGEKYTTTELDSDAEGNQLVHSSYSKVTKVLSFNPNSE